MVKSEIEIGYYEITHHIIFSVKVEFTQGVPVFEAPASLNYSHVFARDSIMLILLIIALNDLNSVLCNTGNAYFSTPCQKENVA